MSHFRSLVDLMGDAKRQMAVMCGEMMGGAPECACGIWRPWTDVYESGDAVIIRMELGGLQPGDAEVTVDGNVVTIRGERRDRCPVRKVAFHQMEIRYGKFQRRIKINVPFDPDRIEARTVEGFLEVVVPKVEPPEPRKVTLSIQV